MTKDRMMWTSSCHLYDYKMTIVKNDMTFQCNYQMIIF
jgi:hypothetical protein